MLDGVVLWFLLTAAALLFVAVDIRRVSHGDGWPARHAAAAAGDDAAVVPGPGRGVAIASLLGRA